MQFLWRWLHKRLVGGACSNRIARPLPGRLGLENRGPGTAPLDARSVINVASSLKSCTRNLADWMS